jgi:O-antigen/teichoic acid export membrane protein
MLYERTRETSVVNVAALTLNVVGDVVLVGVLDTGIIGPAIATIAALTLIVIGYLLVAQRDLRRRPVLPPTLLLPLVAGVVPAVGEGGTTGALLGLGCALAATMVVLWRLRLFSEQDAELIARLDLPAGVRTRAVAAVRRLARD